MPSPRRYPTFACMRWPWLLCGLIFLSSHLSGIDNKRVRIQIDGVEGPLINRHLKNATTIPPYRTDHLLWTRSDLRRAIQDELPRWTQILQGYGYFDARIRVSIEETSYCWVIALHVITGKPYELHEVDFYIKDADVEATQIPLPIEVEFPKIASVKNIAEIEKCMLAYYHNSGYARAGLLTKQLDVNTVDKTARVIWTLNRGRFYTFGPLKLQGLERVHPSFVLHKVLLREGIPYNQELLDQTQNNLESSTQFSACAIGADWPDEVDGSVPLSLAISEAKRRTIAFGVSLMTDAGLGGRFLWENRNLTGAGDLLAWRGYHSKRQKTASVVYNRPDIFLNQTNLRLQLEYNDEQPDSYTDHSWQTGAFFERRLNKRLFFSYGISLLYIETFDTNDDSKMGLLNFPVTATWTNATNPLNPMDGRSHQLQVTPYGALSNSSYFVKIIFKNGFYFPLSESMTLALGLQIGSLTGSVLSDIPPPLRFFEGGPSGFRGYAYKTVSPLDSNQDPYGGRSYTLMTLEPRFRLSDDFAFVPFYEIGRVYAREDPGFGSGYLQSAGIGVSYDTMIGPIRFDFAMPLNKRRGIDPSFQIYLNVGPAF